VTGVAPIRFLNHASFLVNGAAATLLIDPYLFGPAFNNGWDLVWDNVPYEGLARVTHIWLSHEHPDHFSPPFLQSIPAALRQRITVLYRETPDKRVVDFCRQLGFATVELLDRRPYRIEPGFIVRCGHVPLYDSWLEIELGGLTILNLNDCLLNTRPKLERVVRVVRHPDVLFSQFSYASWHGNPDEPQRRRTSAAAILERLRLQCEMLRPAIVVPFASFIHFSHAENAFMNDAVNTPRTVFDFLRANTASQPVFLVPNETWNGRSTDRATAGADAWFVAARARSPRSSAPIPEEQIGRACDAFLKRMRARNSPTLLRLLLSLRVIPALTLFVWDLDKTYRFSYRDGLTELAGGAADIALGSDSLAFLFNFDFGADTLAVNGRFRATAAGRRKFLRAFAVPILNNMGRFVNASFLRTAVEPAFVRQGLGMLGVFR
jgi:UDP-MurNAc hydroxylase